MQKVDGKSQYKQEHSSIWDNPRIVMGKHSFCWDPWQRNGICVIDDLYKSYQELVDQFLLEGRGELWKYLQLRSSV